MADYYPLLAKALANLPSRSAPTARRAIYERARKALIGQLRSIQPPMPEGDIANEDAALDRAIARLEAEYGAQTATGAAPAAPTAAQKEPGPAPATPAAQKAPGLTPAAPTAAPKTTAPTAPPSGPRPTTPAAPSSPTASPRAPLSPPAAAHVPASSAQSGANLRTPAASPSAPPTPTPPPASPPPPLPSGAPNPLPKYPLSPPTVRRPILGAAPATANSGPAAAPAVDSVEPAANAAWPSSAAPPIAAQRASSADDRGHAPAVAPSPPSALTIPPALRAGADIGRPIAPGRAQAPRRDPWPLIALAVLAGAAGAVAVAAYLWRDAPQEAASKAPAEIADKTGRPGQSKIAERVPASGQNNPAPAPAPSPGPAPGESPIPVVTVPVAPVPAAPTHPSDNGQTAAATQTPAAQAPAAQTPTAQAAAPSAAVNPAVSRAAMLIGNSNDPQKPLVVLGNAVWSLIPPTSPNQPSTVAVRIEVDIPDQKMHATVTIRKNADASLPATHTIDLRATFADGAEIKGIKDMGLPQLRKDDLPSGDAVSGVRVKINDSYYLVGLTRSDADAAHNLDLLATDNWLDFPLLLNDDRIAKLTFEKGAVGDQVMAQALNAWK